jgi:methyl-galactoside transport system substrate-binding protein
VRHPLALAAAVLLLASCSAAGKERPKIGLAMPSFDDAASVAIRKAIETKALDKAELAAIDGKNFQSAQDKQVESLIAGKLGALAIGPVDPNGLGSVIAKAKAGKVPIVFFDRRPSDAAMRSWDKLFFVGTRETDGGAAQGEILAARWKARPADDRNKDGTLQFAVVAGEAGSPDPLLLAEACAKALAGLGLKSELLAPASDGAAEPRKATAELIAKYGDRIEAAICCDEASTLGAIEAFRAAGYLKPKKPQSIVALCPGGLPPSIAKALSEGSLAGAAYGDLSRVGEAVFDLAYALAKGGDPSRAGWRIADAKYVWIACKKAIGN